MQTQHTELSHFSITASFINLCMRAKHFAPTHSAFMFYNGGNNEVNKEHRIVFARWTLISSCAAAVDKMHSE